MIRIGRFDSFAPRECGGGEYRTEEYPDVVQPGQFTHRGDIVHHVFEFDRAVVLCDIVRPARITTASGQFDDVRTKACEHLRRGLAADAPADVAVVREKTGAHPRPSFGDRIAHEDGFGVLFCGAVRFAVTIETRPIFLLPEQSGAA